MGEKHFRGFLCCFMYRFNAIAIYSYTSFSRVFLFTVGDFFS